MRLHTRILVGLVAGAAAGVTVNLLTDGGAGTQRFVSLVTEPVGRMWLAALIMVVIPLIVSTLALGVAGLGSLRQLGRIGAITLGSFLGISALAAVFGLTAMNLFRPGHGLDPEIKDRLMETYRGQADETAEVAQRGFGIDLLVRVVPRNPVQAAASGDILAVIFFALMVGVALASLPRERARPLMEFFESVAAVTVAIIELVMKLAPIGVFCLIFSVTARFGFDLLLSLARYVVTVIGTMGVFVVLVYPLILSVVSRWRPATFFRQARLVMLTAFSTSSSSATLPTTMRVAEQDMGLPREIAGFVLPLGATINMNGTALFEGATALFLAQVFGVNLSLSAQVVVVVMSVVAAVGVAGIPGGSIPLLMMVLAVIGVPVEAIAIVLGVDRILDMCRTTLNVTGDLVTATVVNRFSGLPAQSGASTEAGQGDLD